MGLVLQKNGDTIYLICSYYKICGFSDMCRKYFKLYLCSSFLVITVDFEWVPLKLYFKQLDFIKVTTVTIISGNIIEAEVCVKLFGA